MSLLGIDIGTTHIKAGLFGMDGLALRVASHPNHAVRSPEGNVFYDPEALWRTIVKTVREALNGESPGGLQAAGVTGMAETGLLLDRRSGQPRTSFLPWFDAAASPQAGALARAGDPLERFIHTGLRISFKAPLAKLLMLRENQPHLLPGAVWLSVEDYTVFRMTAGLTTDWSLAGRTGAYDIERKDWDDTWLSRWGLDSSLFPPANPAGQVAGRLSPGAAQELGLPAGLPVAVCGHDHVCAAFAAGATRPDVVFDSMGTAESLVGALPDAPLGEREYRSGLAYGLHVQPGLKYWMAGLSTSGGAIEWLRNLLGSPPLSYDTLFSLVDEDYPRPGQVVFFPYLSGSGAPHSAPDLRAALLNLDRNHGAADLLLAALEGTAYELEMMRRAAEFVAGRPIGRMVASGGGTRSPLWMQIKADVCGCDLEALDMPEMALQGAALLAGLGVGVFRDEPEMRSRLKPYAGRVYHPHPQRHAAYQSILERQYIAFQEPLRALGAREND